jgi:methylthioribose-1-phosphate isomerase
MIDDRRDTVRAIRWTGVALQLLDQRLLPHQHVYQVLSDVQGVARAIAGMMVRGAPAIGIAAAYGVVLAARDRYAASPTTWRQDMNEDLELLRTARPTAVNLSWALSRMRRRAACAEADPVPSLLEEALAVHNEDIQGNYRMGEFGAALFERPGGVLTHCNTGALATGGYGTALGVIRSAYAQGRVTRVFVDETRPWLQGARLTAWELVQEGIPVTLLADSAAAHLLRGGGVQWVIVGADRIAANGDVANKIGTYGLALAARFHGVPFMVVAPTSTIDLSIETGAGIPIEQRAAAEVLSLGGRAIAASGADAWNPAFDITTADLIDAIVTERGVVHHPSTDRIAALMQTPAPT